MELRAYQGAIVSLIYTGQDRRVAKRRLVPRHDLYRPLRLPDRRDRLAGAKAIVRGIVHSVILWLVVGTLVWAAARYWWRP